MSIGAADFCAAGVAGSLCAYVKIQNVQKKRSVAGEERTTGALKKHAGLFPKGSSAGRYHRFVSFAAVIPSLVEPVRAGFVV